MAIVAGSLIFVRTGNCALDAPVARHHHGASATDLSTWRCGRWVGLRRRFKFRALPDAEAKQVALSKVDSWKRRDEFPKEFVRVELKYHPFMVMAIGNFSVKLSMLNVVLHDQPQISGAHAAAGSSDAKVA